MNVKFMTAKSLGLARVRTNELRDLLHCMELAANDPRYADCLFSLIRIASEMTDEIGSHLDNPDADNDAKGAQTA